MKKRLIALSVAGIIVILDQLTKFVISQMRPHVKVIPGFFTLNYVENTGAAFGILQGKQFLLALVSLFAIGVLVFLIMYERDERKGLFYALALILGGTGGNLIDRVRLGYVIDFLQFYVKQYYWPSFNVADSAITIGVGILILITLRESQSQPSSQASQQELNQVQEHEKNSYNSPPGRGLS